MQQPRPRDLLLISVVVQEINRYYPEKERKKKPVVVQDHQHTKLQFKQEKALQEITTMSIFPSPLLKA